MSIILFVISIYIFLAYYYEWEHSKKHWQKGIPYSKFDKTLGIIMSIVVLIFSFFLFVKSFFK
jgi:hypothetical protein